MEKQAYYGIRNNSMHKSLDYVIQNRWLHEEEKFLIQNHGKTRMDWIDRIVDMIPI